MRCLVSVVLLALICTSPSCREIQKVESFLYTPLAGEDNLVFTSFRHKQEEDLYLFYSKNGMAWKSLGSGASFMSIKGAGYGFRDPWVGVGPDGVFRMLWTTGQVGMLGYAESRDLMDWSQPRLIRVMKNYDNALNHWAPEAFYDNERREWIVFWSSTVKGEFADTDAGGDMNHRVYACTTRDFRSVSDAFLFFDPGHNCIDATIHEHNGQFYLFYKDERVNPWMKFIAYATGPSPRGPWTVQGRTSDAQWIEGPSAIDINGRMYVYYDWHDNGRYGGMVLGEDGKWTDRTLAMTFPAGHRHGTVIRVSQEVADKLLARE